MAKVPERKIKIPEGIEVSVEKGGVSVRGNGKELFRKFNIRNIDVSVKDGDVVVNSSRSTKREAKMAGTLFAHLKNMINGLKEEFVYKLEICNVHFPMNVKVEGSRVIIKSFLGETTQRIAKIVPSAKVEIKGSEIVVSSSDIEAAGQTAANIEKATRLEGRDRRIFQDGVYIKEKCGRKI